MGRLNHEPVINHFSHPHPLKLTNLQFPSQPQPCSACNRYHSSDGWMYSCNICNFSLHLSCAQLPSLITHPSHPIHSLTLLPTPAYSGGAFNCDGCGRDGRGFCYHCAYCGFDLHTSCAQKPLSVSHQSHHFHLLHLTFDSPYSTKGFSCDICKKLGFNHWLYRCGACEFDAHMECAMNSNSSSNNVFLQHSYSFPGQQLSQRPLQEQQPVYLQSQSLGAINYVQGGGGVYDQKQPAGNNNGIMDTMVQGILDGAVQQIGQSFVQSIMCGGSGGSNDSSNGGGGDLGSSIVSSLTGNSESQN